ncbi:MAG: adenine deaminase [Deltaproteobacteria bacterium]|nr:adenine deaminase [Deltaproteobacteria bacterium]
MEGAEKTRALMQVCLGNGQADRALTNATILNVYTGEWIRNQTILIKGEWIALVGTETGEGIGPKTSVIDASGKAVIPGLIEGHTHLADCLYSPAEFLRRAMIGGTTTIVTESIEPFPIRGEEGIIDFLDAFRDQPIKVFGTLPSMASTSRSSRGMPRDTLRRLLMRDDVLGLGESYWQSVLQDPDVFLGNFEETLLMGAKVEGHSAGAKGRNLAAYVITGISSCHEPINAEEALERLRLGLHVMVREGSIRSDLGSVAALKDAGIDSRRILLVTDGVRPIDLIEKGYMEYVVQRAIDTGIDSVKAIQMATINVADYFGLDGIIGGISPGKQADLLILPDEKTIKAEIVMSKGRIIARDGELLASPRVHAFAAETRRSVHLPRAMTPQDFAILVERPGSQIRVRVIRQITDLVTREEIMSLPVVQGEIRCDLSKDLLKVAAVERRFTPGNIFVGLIRGFGLKSGALAASSAWDTSDIIVVGANEADMAGAVNRIHALQGGLVLCADGKVVAEIPLPIFGLMTELPLPDLVVRMRELTMHAKALGFPFADPHKTLIPLTGAAIPFIRLSDEGLVDIKSGKKVPLIVGPDFAE